MSWVEVLNNTEKSIVTLFACTPLFSGKNRLIVIGELLDSRLPLASL